MPVARRSLKRRLRSSLLKRENWSKIRARKSLRRVFSGMKKMADEGKEKRDQKKHFRLAIIELSKAIQASADKKSGEVSKHLEKGKQHYRRSGKY